MTLRKVRVGWDYDGDGHYDESSEYREDGAYYYVEDVDAHVNTLTARLATAERLLLKTVDAGTAVRFDLLDEITDFLIAAGGD